MDKHQIKASAEGSDITLFSLLLVVSSVVFTVIFANLFDASLTTMWVTCPSMVLGLGTAVTVMWRLRKMRTDKEARWNREKAEIAEQETRRKMDVMLREQSRIPKVEK